MYKNIFLKRNDQNGRFQAKDSHPKFFDTPSPAKRGTPQSLSKRRAAQRAAAAC